ncbi:MAG: hypothetical protein H6577_22735 [Lewinellaceae bacterium]|nr:hypothetical protein [Lewinellaceae bacterium]
MNTDFIHFELLEAWFRGTLNEAERRDMQERMASDELLKAEFEAFATIWEGARTVGDLQLRQAIANAHEDNRQQGFLLTEDDLEGYLQGNLYGEKARLLEQRLKSDEVFAKEMTDRADLLEGIRTRGDLALREQIRQAHQQAKSEGALRDTTNGARIVPFRQRVLRWAIAASVALLAVAGSWWFLSPGNYDEAFAAYYQPNSPFLNSLLDSLEATGFATGKGEAFKAYVAGVQAYERGNFAAAESQIAAWLQQNPGDDNARLMLGLSYLGQQSYKKAAKEFEQLLTSQDAAIVRAAKFYLALAWCKNPFKRGAAERLLRDIANDNTSPHRQAAAMMLEKINR